MIRTNASRSVMPAGRMRSLRTVMAEAVVKKHRNGQIEIDRVDEQPVGNPLFQHLLQVAAALGGAFARHLVVHRRVKTLRRLFSSRWMTSALSITPPSTMNIAFEHVARMAHTAARSMRFFRNSGPSPGRAAPPCRRTIRRASVSRPQLLRDVVHAHRLDALRDEHVHRLFYDSFLLIHDPIRLIRMQIYAPKLIKTKKFSVFPVF